MTEALICNKAPAVIVIAAVVQPFLAYRIGKVTCLPVGSVVLEYAEVGIDAIQKVSEQGLGCVTAIPSVD